MVEAAKTLVHSAKIIITFSIEDLCSPSLSIVNRQDPTVEFMKSLCQGILLRNIVSSLAHTAFNEQWCAWEKGILSFNAAKNNHFDGFQNEFDGWRVLCQVDYSEVGYSVSFCWWVLTLQTNQQLEFPPLVRRGNWVRPRGRCPELSTDGWFLGRHFSIFIFIPLHFTTLCILVFLNIWIFGYILNIVPLGKNSHGTKCLSTNLPILFQKSYSL